MESVNPVVSCAQMILERFGTDFIFPIFFSGVYVKNRLTEHLAAGRKRTGKLFWTVFLTIIPLAFGNPFQFCDKPNGVVQVLNVRSEFREVLIPKMSAPCLFVVRRKGSLLEQVSGNSANS
jgi:hypothetical protein